MDLQEVMARFGGHTERLPDAEIEFGKEIELSELVETLDAWQEVWEKLDPTVADRLSHSERRRLKRELKMHAKTLTDMTFRIDVFRGHSTEFIRAHLIRENPEQINLVKGLFQPEPWWLLIGYVKDKTNGGYLDFCHVNTRKVARIKVSADSPVVDYFDMLEPTKPHGEIIVYA